MDKELTLEAIQKAIDLLTPVLYYGTDKNIEAGNVLLVKETAFNPEFIVVHPDDFDRVRSLLIHKRRLVHLKDEPIAEVSLRISKRYQPIVIPYYREEQS